MRSYEEEYEVNKTQNLEEKRWALIRSYVTLLWSVIKAYVFETVTNFVLFNLESQEKLNLNLEFDWILDKNIIHTNCLAAF